MKSFDRSDTNAEERMYSRSLKIRRICMLFLDDHANMEFAEMMDIADQAGNAGKLWFSSTTAYRWIHQFTALNAPFGIQTGANDGWQIFRRRPLTAKDFRKWGIRNVPKRFRKK